MYDNVLQRGFIALTATIIVAAVLLTLVIAVASKGFYGRFNALDAEVKEVSRALAEGCVQTAILEYEKESSYAGGDEITIDGNTCTIVSVDGSLPSAVAVEVHADAKGTVTNLRVVLDSTNDYFVESWEEVP
ncbi:hypothetical protein L0Y40_02615 [Candidatus Wolfebacteria bacterium]|nr:hypothetical protein [Candidatus Wolfebacteria bacterium]